MEERLYDLIFICRPDTPEADIDKVIATLEHTAAEKGAQDREDREVGPQAHGLPRAADCAKDITSIWFCVRATAKW